MPSTQFPTPSYPFSVRKVKLTKTVRVHHKTAGRECIINESDFDPNLHQAIGAAPEAVAPNVAPPVPEAPPASARPKLQEATATPASPPGEATKAEPAMPKVTEAELAAMTLNAMKRLPQWPKVENPSKLSTKSEVIAAILAVEA
jgi:hypothetical protein